MTTHFKTIIFVCSFILGIFVQNKLDTSSDLAVTFLIIFISQILLYFIFYKNKSAINIFIILLSLGISFGIIRAQFIEEKEVFVCESFCKKEIIITSSPKSKDSYQEFFAKVSDEKDFYDIQVRVPLYPKYEIGDKLILGGKVLETKNQVAHNNISKDSSFDYVSYLKTKGVGSSSYYPNLEKIGESNGLIYNLRKLKDGFVERVNLYVSQPESQIASGMILGSDDISRKITDFMRISGISHIIVLSGFNIAILIAFVLLFFRSLPFYLKIVLSVIFVIAFVAMVGAEVSIVRASIMAFISLLALSLGRKYVARQALIVSLFVISLFSPDSVINDPSLHLSFLATCGIVYLSEIISYFYQKTFTKKIFLRLEEIFTTTIASYVATLPYVVYSFGYFSFYGIVSNLLVIPFVPISMFLSLLVILFSYVSESASLIVGFVNTLIVSYIIKVAEIVSLLPFAKVNLNIGVNLFITFYILIIVCFIFLDKKYLNKKEDATNIINY